jgi:RNA polymerase sigma-70 factor (ECF subfamily)
VHIKQKPEYMPEETHQTEEELSKRAATDPDAFGTLIERYHQRLVFFVHRIAYFSSEDVEDILQNAYIKAYKNIYRYDPSMSFSTWLYHIVRNTTLDELRHRAVRVKPYASFDDETILQIASEESIFGDVLKKETLEALKAAMNELPEKYREVLVLRYSEDKSYEEIIDILQLPKGTIAARINRAKKLLAKELHTT